MERFYKLAMPSGFDFYTGKTINYRDAIGHYVSPPNSDKAKGLCSSGMIHASRNINDCFVGASIPCSAYIIEGNPYAEDRVKCGFIRLKVIEEITDLDSAFGWKYNEAIHPINPLKINTVLTDKHKDLLTVWTQARTQVGTPAWDQVGTYVWDQVWDQVVTPVGTQVGTPVGTQVGTPVWTQVRAYTGSLFPKIKWNKNGTYPLQACVDLWKDGFVSSFDGKIWRLHAGEKADIVYEKRFD